MMDPGHRRDPGGHCACVELVAESNDEPGHWHDPARHCACVELIGKSNVIPGHLHDPAWHCACVEIIAHLPWWTLDIGAIQVGTAHASE